MLTFLIKWSRTIMVIGLIVVVAVAFPNFNNPGFHMAKSVPLYIGAAIYILGRVLMQMQINEQKKKK